MYAPKYLQIPSEVLCYVDQFFLLCAACSSGRVACSYNHALPSRYGWWLSRPFFTVTQQLAQFWNFSVFFTATHNVHVVWSAPVCSRAAEGVHHAVPDQAGDPAQGGAGLLQGIPKQPGGPPPFRSGAGPQRTQYRVQTCWRTSRTWFCRGGKYKNKNKNNKNMYFSPTN